MSVYEYDPVVFVGGTDPAISAENLNHGEQGIKRSLFRPGGTFTGSVTTDASFTKKSPVFTGWTYFGGASDTGDYDIRDGTKGFIIPDGFAIAQVLLSVDYGTYAGDQCKVELIHLRGSTETILDIDGADSVITNAKLHCAAFIPVQAGDKIYPYVYGKEAQSNPVVMQIVLL